MNSETNALTIPQRAAIALNSTQTEEQLRALVVSSADITEVKDGAGREQCHRIGMNLKNARIAIEKTRKVACEDATAFSKGCIAEEKRLVAIITPEEDRIFALRDAYDAKIEADKQAKIAAERARIANIETLIYAISDLPRRLQYEDKRPLLESLPIAIAEYAAMQPSEEVFCEFVGRAKDVVAATLEALHLMLECEQEKAAAEQAERERREAEEKRLAAEREELARQKVELDRVAAEQAAAQKRLDDAAKAQQEAERQRQAEEAEHQRVAAENKRQMEAQQAAIAEQRRQLEAEEVAAKLRREAEEIVNRAHEEALLMDAAFNAERLEHDHAEALTMDALFSAQSEALEMNALLDTTLKAEVDRLIANTEPTDQQIIDAYIESFGGTEEQAEARLMRFGGKK